jgi:hypothetical protein
MMTTANGLELISRDAFREGVFFRDKYKCVLCGALAQDAHHILERRLFEDGGYYLNNGASVCGPCHLACESTAFSVETVREAAGITKPVLPDHFYDDQIYDKWGNISLGNNQWLRGELFNDPSVQKVISWKLSLFVPYVKYPRTYHLPWSENLTSDDRMMSESVLHGLMSSFIVVTEKMDGENTTLYRDYIHARSVDSANHESRNWVKNFWGAMAHDIPEGWRICGENLFAEHSIAYKELPTYFMGFSIWNEQNVCLSWQDTLHWFELLGITPAPTLFCGFGPDFRHKLYWNAKSSPENCEGYVIRSTQAFPYGAFRKNVGKFVRKNHVQTVKHWMHGQRMKVNELKG